VFPARGWRCGCGAASERRTDEPSSNEHDTGPGQDLYTSWTSFSTTIDGLDVTVKEGERLRGDVAVVRECFGQFVEDGLPAPEKPTTWEVVAQQDAVAAEAAEAQAKTAVHLVDAPRERPQPV
jgi:hypothetical protein